MTTHIVSIAECKFDSLKVIYLLLMKKKNNQKTEFFSYSGVQFITILFTIPDQRKKSIDYGEKNG